MSVPYYPYGWSKNWGYSNNDVSSSSNTAAVDKNDNSSITIQLSSEFVSKVANNIVLSCSFLSGTTITITITITTNITTITTTRL